MEELFVSHEKVKSFTVNSLEKLGYYSEDANIIAEILIDSDLRGIETHGITRLVQYAKLVLSGKIDPKKKQIVVDDSSITAILDAQFGLGYVSAFEGMKMAISKANVFGVGIVGIKNSGHFGAAGYYPLMASSQNMVGVIMTNTRALLPVLGGKVPVIGNNPLAFSAPTGKDQCPFLFDMSCSKVSFGKIRMLAAANKQMDSDWGFNKHGNPTNDPIDLLEKGGFLAPFGGHKGIGIALMIEILSAILTGSSFGQKAGGLQEEGTDGCGHLIIVMNISKFTNLESFKENMDQFISQIKNSKKTDGHDIRIPGERGFLERKKRLKRGIFISEEVIKELKWLSNKLNIPLFTY